MEKYIVMGNPDTDRKAFQAFYEQTLLQDRAAGATQLSEAVGGKMEYFDIVRGKL